MAVTYPLLSLRTRLKPSLFNTCYVFNLHLHDIRRCYNPLHIVTTYRLMHRDPSGRSNTVTLDAAATRYLDSSGCRVGAMYRTWASCSRPKNVLGRSEPCAEAVLNIPSSRRRYSLPLSDKLRTFTTPVQNFRAVFGRWNRGELRSALFRATQQRYI
jgi:hypothetical protein